MIARWGVVDVYAEHPDQIDLSSYAYVDNNPISKTDPDGNCPNCLIGAAIGAVFGAVVEGGSQLIIVAILQVGELSGEQLYKVELKARLLVRPEGQASC